MPVKINFFGDIGLFKKFEELNIDPFDSIEMPPADLNIGNFEFIVPKNRNKFFYDVQDVYSCSYAYAEKLKINRFDGFSLANNHCLDYGLDGAKDTIALLREKGVKMFGFSEGPDFTTCSFEHNGLNIALIGCVKKGRWTKEKFGYGPDTYDPVKIIDLIRNLKNKNDHIIVFMHWGTELVEVPDAEDTVIAKKFIDEGALAVIGHHPHVCQGIETYKNGLIAYSLGSFIYVHEEELGFSKKNTNRNTSICLTLEVDKNGIIDYSPVFYRYNSVKKIPEMAGNKFGEEYSAYLNGIIYDKQVFKNQFKKVFFKRELKSFFLRFKNDPAGTLVTYIKLLNVKRIRKIFSI
jgi:hypothetical protein